MKWSRFAHVIPEYGVIWHALTFKTTPLDTAILKASVLGRNIPAGLLDQATAARLAEDGFILDDAIETEPCLAALSGITATRTEVQALYLILSTKCNLKCKYCLYGSAQSGSLSGHGEHMSVETARQAIELFARETAKNDSSRPGYWEEMTFYGGEPLLNPQCLTEAMRHVRQLQRAGRLRQELTFVLNTNGTLLTPQILEFLRKEDIRIHVSIDGPQEVHDKVRVLHSGKGSYAKVVSGLELMRSLGVDFTPLLTVTEANLPGLGGYVESLCRRYGVKRYGLNLLMHTGGEVDPGYGKRAAKAMLEAHAAAAPYGAVDQMYEDACQAFTRQAIATQSCGGGRKLVVFPQGGIHACQALEASGTTAMGQMPDFDPVSPQRLHWLERNRFKHPTCLACPAIGGCGGGCGASAHNAGNGIQGIDPNHCAWMMTIFRGWLESTLGQKTH